MYRCSKILNTKQYKYLGIEIDSTLNPNTHFEKCFKRASSRLRLMAKKRDSLDLISAKAVYNSIILPTFMYCGVLQLKLTSTQAKRLWSFQDRCLKIINGNSKNPTAIQSVANGKSIRACKLVRKCLNNDICENFQGYFELQQHKTRTINSECLIRLPGIKTEYSRKSFHFMGTKLYNELPIDLRKTESFKQYEGLLTRYFS